MFAKLPADKLKKRANLKNQLVGKLKENAIKCMPPIKSIIDDLFPKKVPVIVYSLENHVKLYAVNDKPVFVELGTGEIFPMLKTAIAYPGLLPTIYVDEGAVRAVLRNADLMAPGIKGISQELEAGRIVQINLLDQSSPFAIGITTVSSEEWKANPSGIAIKTLHILRDGLYMVEDGF